MNSSDSKSTSGTCRNVEDGMWRRTCPTDVTCSVFSYDGWCSVFLRNRFSQGTTDASARTFLRDFAATVDLPFHSAFFPWRFWIWFTGGGPREKTTTFTSSMSLFRVAAVYIHIKLHAVFSGSRPTESRSGWSFFAVRTSFTFVFLWIFLTRTQMMQVSDRAHWANAFVCVWSFGVEEGAFSAVSIIVRGSGIFLKGFFHVFEYVWMDSIQQPTTLDDHSLLVPSPSVSVESKSLIPMNAWRVPKKAPTYKGMFWRERDPSKVENTTQMY